MSNFSCPNCGLQTEQSIELVKMASCAACGTTLFLRGKALSGVCQQGEMHDAPLLFGLGSLIRMGSEEVRILGHVRYSYGRGFWDEFWGVNSKGSSRWVSVDEGDVVLQKRIPAKHEPQVSLPADIGRMFSFNHNSYTVAEAETATCVALRGSFDEVLQAGETHQFCNAQSEEGHLLTGETWTGGKAWYQGDWSDPFDVKVLERP